MDSSTPLNRTGHKWPGKDGYMGLVAKWLPWLLSAITVYMTVLAGNKTPWAWSVGLANQALWLVWIVAVGAWGLIPMNIALWVVYARNHLKWTAPNKAL